MKRWVRVGASNKVTGHQVTTDDHKPAADLFEVLGEPPFVGGTYNPATKLVTGVPPGQPDPLDPLRAKPAAQWTDTDRATALKAQIGG